jgi:dTDP-glucose 4,6-dehydratase
MRILVTGGLGFIGSNFIRYMLTTERNVEIVNLDKMGIGSNIENLRDLERDERYKFVKGDLNDSTILSKLIGEVDAVVNFAAETHVDRSIADPKTFLENNTIATFNLLENARRFNRGVRIVHVSTDEVYSDIIAGSYDEESRLKPSSPYSASKAAADMFCHAYHRTYGLDVVITRCVNNFGPYQFPEKLIPKTIIRAYLGLKVPIYGSGRNVRDWIYVLDHCEALKLILEKGVSGETYNISAGNEYENIDVVKRILEIMGRDESLIEFVEDRPGHDLRYSLNSSKIRRKLGWKPSYSFEHALKRTVEWYMQNECWWKPLANEEVLHPTPWRLKW